MMEGGERLKRRRAQLELTQRQLGLRMKAEARRLGDRIATPANSTISCWETSKRTPSPYYAMLLCRVLGAAAADLDLEHVLTPDRMAELTAAGDGVSFRHAAALAQEWHSQTPRWPAAGSGSLIPGQGAGIERVDWDRLNSAMRVDRRTVDDQWTLTRLFVDAMLPLECRSHLALITEHLVRLRSLRGLAGDDGLRHELGLLACESAICAGVAWSAQTDYGLSMEANRYAAELASELGEPSPRSVALVMQAQLYGGRLHPRLAAAPSRMRRLIEEAVSISDGASPEARLVVCAVAAQLHAQFGEEAPARRGVELARRAEADMGRDARPYCGLTSPGFRPALEGLVEEALGHSDRAIPLLSEAIARTDPGWRWHGQEAWLLFALATSYARDGAADLAAPRVSRALDAARTHEVPFLIRGIEGFAEGLMAQAPRDPAVQQLGEVLDQSA